MSDSSGIGSTDRKMTGPVQEILSSSIVSQDSVQRSWIRTWGRSPPQGLAREALSRTVPQCPQIANAVSGSSIIHHWIAELMSFPSLCSTFIYSILSVSFVLCFRSHKFRIILRSSTLITRQISVFSIHRDVSQIWEKST